MEGTIEQLLSLDPARLDVDGRLNALLALDKLSSRVAARIERVLASLADPGDEKDFVREEVRTLLRWSDGYTRAKMAQAHKLITDLPDALDAHEAGVLNCAQTRALVEGCAQLGQSACAEVAATVLPRAGSQTLTLFKQKLTRTLHAVDPRTAEQKHAADRKQRDVSIRPLPNGMAGIWSVHTAIDADAIMTRVNAVAAAKASGDVRLVGERRADALANLVLGVPCPEQQTHHGRRQTTCVLVPWDVAAGFSDAPGELVGFGPIPASLCREAMSDETAAFVRWVISPLGEVLDCSTSYEPNQATQDLVVARDRTCRMPGCNRKAGTCELDHRVPFDGGNTTVYNLQALCCRHHHVKHEAGWHCARLVDGTIAWTSPTGRYYEKPPDDLPGWAWAPWHDDPDPP